ncbi:MAG: DUF4347 domain-containing protein, partial [Phormidesmis sp.]
MLLTSSPPAPTVGAIEHSPKSKGAFVVLDSGVNYLPLLVSSLTHADVLVLDPDRDGIEQITAALSARQAVSSLHIVSHGTPGQLLLGNAQLDFESLGQYAEQLETWADKLQGKDVLLYGCQVAKGAMGYLFLQQLRQLTGANLAASEQRVGRMGDRANWSLNTRLGEVNTPLIFSQSLQASYPGHFDPVVDFSINTNTVIESEGTPVTFNFRLSEPPPEGGTVIRWEGSIPQAINQLDLFALTTQ